MGMRGEAAGALYDIQDRGDGSGDGLQFRYEEADSGKIKEQYRNKRIVLRRCIC